MNRPDVQRLDTYHVTGELRAGRPKWLVMLWWIVRDTLFLCSPQPMYGFRRWLIRLFGAKIGHHVLLRPTVRVYYPWNITIGDYAQIGDFVELYSLAPITIGEHAVVSQRSYICTGAHDHRSLSFDLFAKPIEIEPQAWVATDVFVGPGVKIGFGALIAARSTVMRDAPPLKILAGTPARVVGDRKASDKAQAGASS